MRFTRVLFVVSLLALVLVPAALAIRFTDESYNPPLGETGKPYPNWSFTGAGGCAARASLPVHAAEQLVAARADDRQERSCPRHPELRKASFRSGSNSAMRTRRRRLGVRPATAQRMFTIKIVAGLNIQQQALTPKVASLNKPYSLQLTATGGGSQAWSIAVRLAAGRPFAEQYRSAVRNADDVRRLHVRRQGRGCHPDGH